MEGMKGDGVEGRGHMMGLYDGWGGRRDIDAKCERG